MCVLCERSATAFVSPAIYRSSEVSEFIDTHFHCAYPNLTLQLHCHLTLQAKQLKDYENAVIAKRLEELDEDEIQALQEEVERDAF
jgi:hypothetical protein